MSNDNDDLIIDLTELMDEEDSVKRQDLEKPESQEKKLKLETEAFDLGRELTNDNQPDNKSKEEFDFDKVFRESLDSIASPKKPVPEQPPKKDEPEFPFEERLDEALSEKTLEQNVETEFDFKPFQAAEPSNETPNIEAIQEYLKKGLPEMVESIARPIISELVNEIVASVKGDLPGIIEKVIREEIEKLKKID
jgi:hypothetical protein